MSCTPLHLYSLFAELLITVHLIERGDILPGGLAVWSETFVVVPQRAATVCLYGFCFYFFQFGFSRVLKYSFLAPTPLFFLLKQTEALEAKPLDTAPLLDLLDFQMLGGL